MRVTVDLDDELIKEARRITGISERAWLLHEGLLALIERESARRPALLGGTQPQLTGGVYSTPESIVLGVLSWRNFGKF